MRALQPCPHASENPQAQSPQVLQTWHTDAKSDGAIALQPWPHSSVRPQAQPQALHAWHGCVPAHVPVPPAPPLPPNGPPPLPPARPEVPPAPALPLASTAASRPGGRSARASTRAEPPSVFQLRPPAPVTIPARPPIPDAPSSPPHPTTSVRPRSPARTVHDSPRFLSRRARSRSGSRLQRTGGPDRWLDGGDSERYRRARCLRRANTRPKSPVISRGAAGRPEVPIWHEQPEPLLA